MRTCSYVKSKGNASAAPSRDLELVKPAGLHFVEEKPRVTNLFYPEREIPVKYTSLPTHIFPCPLPYSYEAYESVVGHVSRMCQRVSSRTASHRVNQSEMGDSEVELEAQAPARNAQLCSSAQISVEYTEISSNIKCTKKIAQ